MSVMSSCRRLPTAVANVANRSHLPRESEPQAITEPDPCLPNSRQIRARVRGLNVAMSLVNSSTIITRGMGATRSSFEIHPLGQVAAVTHADNLRHGYLRVHFMNALLCDPRIIRLFETWGRETGLYPAADAVARAGRVSHAAKVVEALDSTQVADGSAAEPALDAGASLAERFNLML